MHNPETPPGGWVLWWVVVFAAAWVVLFVGYLLATAAL